ncbi:putative Fe-S cluster assembly protein SufT [Cobetia marina]|uniref:Fe-S cluster assembly protein SufT n=1 Tax=Cobetia marina TaxID=28258 RepID=A0ABU9GCI5_COBMA|nr:MULTISPECIES: putative Fe-S cluster assembly protein SufT [Cobetia]MDA5562186.1 putative Fe-S cluster assembly protein SufT [Cobetia sp. MMG027]MDH2290334.1 putative Fe-S cluster assembly protein SufT [Cobetia sp. 10Alg 146]MDI6002128.1 putative Fe-S cluster assembly protein SufT [Cobetia pacifica]MDN2655243.1 putative Fe-S cluster assembly protein SufT [Cobetia sp. 14N.309.X.WAT.E.A4]MDO6788008.1 putative Fe-S cluster assembly protein SufT [Cobetia marina]
MSHTEDQLASLGKGQKMPLQRDVEGISVPFGKSVTLHEDSVVEVMQAKGGTVSVAYEGRMYLIESFSLDALGLDAVPRPHLPAGQSDAEIEAFVWAQLRTCFDPEIPVDIVELGLVYGCRIDTLISGEKMVNLKMTLTAPGCGMGNVIAEDAKRKILGAEDVSKVHVEIVFSPPWSREMMSEEARLELGMF